MTDRSPRHPLRHDAPRRHPGREHHPQPRRQAADRPDARRVRHALHRGRLARLEPEGHRVLQGRPDDDLADREARRVRLDPPPRRTAPRTTRTCASSSPPRRRSSRSSARAGCSTSPRSSARRRRRTSTWSRTRVGFVVERGRELVYDAEHFFDGYRDDPRLRARDAAGGPRGRRPDARPVRHERRHADRRARRDRDRRPRRARGGPRRPAARRSTWGIHTHNDAELAVANSMAAVAGRRPPRPGHDQRLRRAGRQRQHGLDPREPRPEDRPRARPGRRRRADRPDRAQPVRRRDRQPSTRTTGSRTSAGRRSPTRAASTAPPSRRSSGATSTSTRPRSATQGRLVVSASWAAGPTPGSAPSSSATSSRASIDPKVLSELVKQLESEGLAFEGAEASFELLIRRHQADYAAPFRIVDYTVPRRAARRPRAPRRGDGQGRGRRRGPPHRGRRQRPGQRPRRGAAQGAPGVLSAARRRPPRTTTRSGSSTATRRRPPGRG